MSDTSATSPSGVWPLRWLAVLALVSFFLPFLTGMLALWLHVTPLGSDLQMMIFFMGFVMFFMPGAGGILVVPFALVGVFFRATRPACAPLLAVFLMVLPGLMTGLSAGRSLRMQGMVRCAERSMVLVEAIEAYSEREGHPPVDLEALVPDYLPEVPHTGLGAYPDYNYATGEDVAKDYHGNPWVLHVNTSIFILNWDILLYLPLRNYPEQGYGGRVERIGAWAYVHE